MGVDKARVLLDGQPLALRVAAEVAKVCGSVALVGDPQKYQPLGLTVVPDKFPGLGPLAGIEAALGATQSEWNLIVACDMPALHPSLFLDLFAACVAEGNADGRNIGTAAWSHSVPCTTGAAMPSSGPRSRRESARSPIPSALLRYDTCEWPVTPRSPI
jgi:molybdopterin-guanine dinucleotide biosynthesis protein A